MSSKDPPTERYQTVTDFSLPTYRDDYVKFGDYYYWVEPPYPKIGEQWHSRELKRGQMPIEHWHPRSRDGKYRRGGNWLCKTSVLKNFGNTFTTFRGGEGPAYTGRYYISDSSDLSYEDPITMGSQEDFWAGGMSYGAQAYDALKPDKPDFSAALALAELKDPLGGLKDRFKKMIRKTNTHRNSSIMSKAGKYHLQIQFGWLPLISDTLEFIEAYSGRNKRFKQMLVDEGKWVRRRRNLQYNGDKNGEFTDPGWNAYFPWSSNPHMQPVHVSQCYYNDLGKTASTTVKLHRHTKVWCAGKSKYWLPGGYRNKAWAAMVKRRILGLNPDAATVYNLIPWSWLLDYFTTTGDMYDAISGGIADHVIFDYAYVMREVKATLKQKAVQYCVSSQDWKHTEARATRILESSIKLRLGASPFGFGLKHEDLSSHQIGILGALGLSYLP